MYMLCVTHVYRNDDAMFVEERALLQALQDSELSKLDTSDALVMNMLLGDLFKVNTQGAANDLLKVMHCTDLCYKTQSMRHG